MIESHDLIKVDSLYLFVGEAYYPTYRTETTTNPVTGQTELEQVFDGYQYTHATVVVFDELGNMLWDKTLNMWQNFKPYVPKEFITVSVKEQQINLLFVNKSSIYSAAYSLFGEVVNEKDFTFLTTDNKNDEIRYSFADIVYWYENFFLAFGLQKLVNESNNIEVKKRRVFFINKIFYQ